jgi:hypothetical protein
MDRSTYKLYVFLVCEFNLLPQGSPVQSAISTSSHGILVLSSLLSIIWRLVLNALVDKL